MGNQRRCGGFLLMSMATQRIRAMAMVKLRPDMSQSAAMVMTSCKLLRWNMSARQEDRWDYPPVCATKRLAHSPWSVSSPAVHEQLAQQTGCPPLPRSPSYTLRTICTSNSLSRQVAHNSLARLPTRVEQSAQCFPEIQRNLQHARPFCKTSSDEIHPLTIQMPKKGYRPDRDQQPYATAIRCTDSMFQDCIRML